jgi:AhpD family alkylhydroperoxidase
MSVAVAITTQCAYCIDVHTARAAAAGATRQEVAEAAFIAAALRAGAAVGHGLLALRLFDAAAVHPPG